MGNGDPIQISSDLLLVHEGAADSHVIGALMRHHNIQGFQPLPLNGGKKIRRFLKALSLSPHFKNPVPGFSTPVRSLAIVVDAEQDSAATFHSISSALLAAELPVPSSLGEITEGALRVGVFLVPDNKSAGKIESLCLSSVSDDPAWNCLDTFFNCVNERGVKLPANMDKARAQAFLSTRPEPDLPVGLAATEGYWKLDSPAFMPLVDFLRNLSNPA